MIFIILGVLCFVLFFLDHKFNNILSEKFPAVWRNFGELDPMNFSMKKTGAKLIFVLTGKYRNLGDPQLAKIGNYLRVLHLAYLMIFVIYTGLLLISFAG